MKSVRRSSSSPTSIQSNEQRDGSKAGLLDGQGGRTDLKETISILETRGKKLCSKLQSLQMDRAELMREVELLSDSLEKRREGSVVKSTECKRHCRRQFPKCLPHSPCEDYEPVFSAPEGKLKFDWSDILNWPNLHTLGIVSTGLENEIFGNCERLRCKSCALGQTCHCKDMKFSRCKTNGSRASCFSLPKTRSCRWCKVDKCKGDIDFPMELKELPHFIDEYDCSCTICATNCPYTGSSSSRSYDLEADSSLEFPMLENASKMTQDCNTLLEVDKLCRLDRSSEALKHPKNQNHNPKKLSRNCSCPLDQPHTRKCTKYLTSFKKEHENVDKLRATMEILERNCRTKDDVIAALIDEFKRNVSVDRILRSLTDVDVKRRVHWLDRSATASLSNRELKSGQNQDRSRKRDIFFGLFLLLLIVLPVWFRLYKHISLEVASVLDYLCYWARYAVLQFQMSFPSYKRFTR